MALKSYRTLYGLYDFNALQRDGGYHYSNYEEAVHSYLVANYNNAFLALWSYLNCTYKLYLLYANSHNTNPYKNGEKQPKNEDDYNELYNMLDEYQIINYENLLIPLIMPLKVIFFKLHHYSNHEVYLSMSANVPAAARGSAREGEEDGESALKKIIDNLRKMRFISLHNAKGRTLSTFYAMPTITLHEHLSNLSIELLLEPIKSDLYLLTELNTNLSVYQLNKDLTNNVAELLLGCKTRRPGARDEGDNWVILLRILKYLNAYSNASLEELFNLRKNNFALSQRLQTMLSAKDGNSGGIAAHPVLPVYAIVLGATSEKATPAYTVSMQHLEVLSNEFKFSRNELVLKNLININHVSTLQLATFHSSNIFGDLLCIEWSGDSLCAYDKFGWALIYHMKNLVYAPASPRNGKGETVSTTLPTVAFKTHCTAHYMRWLGEYFVLTMGLGIQQESMDQDIAFVNLSLRQGEPDAEPRTAGREPMSMQMLSNFCEGNLPCVCVWNLVEHNANNVPKIKAMLSFCNGASKAPPENGTPRVTSILAVKNEESANGSKEVGLEYDLLVFDSAGVYRAFSVREMDVVRTSQLENCEIVDSFLLLNGNFVTVSEEGNIRVYRVRDLSERPRLIFEAAATAVEPRETAQTTSLVTTIGDFISQKFARDKQPQAQPQLKIVGARLYSRQFVVVIYSDEQVSTTQLPDFTVY